MIQHPAPHIAVLITSHNRHGTTLQCLHALNNCRRPDDAQISIVLTDDGSTDGTAETVSATIPNATVLNGDGSLFWNRGMHRSFAHALDQGHDFYLWLNDDTLLNEDALELLLATFNTMRAQTGKASIVVGSTHDIKTGALTYGGVVRASRWRPLKLTLIPPTAGPQACDAMNGNCVLIPAEAALKIGNLDWSFEHSIGDFDYALRARKLGIPLWIAPGYVGTCSRNELPTPNKSMSWIGRIRFTASRKNLPPKSWAIYTQRHGGILWPIYFLWPYVKSIFRC